MQVLDFISIVPWTMIIQWANLCIICLLLKKFLFQPVRAVLEKRQAEITATYEIAETAKTSAQAMQAEYETRLENAKAEATDIVKTATTRATVRSEEMVNEAKAEVAALKAKADKEITAERQKAAGELKQDIAGMALGIAGKVIEKEIDANVHKSLIDSFIDHVGDAS